MSFRTIEHTADIGIEVEADTLAGLFAEAALGMLSLIVDPTTVSRVEQRSISLAAGDIGELMFRWLNELLYLVYAEELVFAAVRVGRVGPDALEAEVEGERLDPARHQVGEEIKAATYHQLTVERRGEGWFARVIFDV